MNLPRILLAGVLALALGACGDAPEGQGQRTASQGSDSTVPADALVRPLSSKELAILLAQGRVQLIDVRKEEEVASGMIPGAVHVPLSRLDPRQIDFSDGREPVFYCRSGRRSALAARKFAAHSHRTVRHLEGGIQAWQAERLELAPGPKGDGANPN